MNELEAITTFLAEKELPVLIDLVETATNENRQNLEITGKPIFELRALHDLGFIFLYEKTELRRLATLLPPALYRYKHEKRNLLRKFIRIAVLRYKDTMAIAAFFISTGLLLLRVLELAGYKLVFE